METIVKTSKGTTATLTWSKNEPLKPEIIKKACPNWFYEEVEEYLTGLVDVIKKIGCK